MAIDNEIMIDIGGIGAHAFIDHDFANSYRFTLLSLPQPRVINLAGGESTSDGSITHYVDVKLFIGNQPSNTRFLVTKLGKNEFIICTRLLNHRALSLACNGDNKEVPTIIGLRQ